MLHFHCIAFLRMKDHKHQYYQHLAIQLFEKDDRPQVGNIKSFSKPEMLELFLNQTHINLILANLKIWFSLQNHDSS